MDTKIAAIVIGLLLAIGGVTSYIVLISDNKSSSTQTQDTSQQFISTDSTQQPGSYVDYTEDVIANTSGTKILFFHASWCPQCQELDKDIKANGSPAGVTIIKVNYDNAQSLRQKYGVTIQTTLVKIDDQGKLVKKFVAYNDPSVDSLRKNLL